ncbi:unnamed protein product [Cylindrotheca closterium]|uniref:Uncharacterized protein n=1 Tax=Cylindrotheca closterium TaxID=2856 RepID=A0AAD2FLV6_9STRA|nr:unnamed protein product [Cylindrotheca closterium]
MKAKILTEHPDWKVSERRVKKYIKRHSNGLKLSDMDDESTAVEGTKSKSFIKRIFQKKRRPSQKPPISVIEEGVLQSVSETDLEAGLDPGMEAAGVEAVVDPDLEVKTSDVDTAVEKGKNLDEKIYEEGESEEKKDCECNACIIS